MKITKVRIAEFQSIQDSSEFEIGDVTCLVGKNEAGKTALLKALYRLNPLIESDGTFDVTEDYPRSAIRDYEAAVNAGSRKPAQVVHATYALETDDIEAITTVYGPECLRDDPPTLCLCKGYSNELTFSGLNVDDDAAVRHLVHNAGLPQPVITKILDCASVGDMIGVLAEVEQTDPVQTLTTKMRDISTNGVTQTICARSILPRIPKFLYFDEYYQLRGHDNLEALRNRKNDDTLEGPDHPLLGLIDLAGLDLDSVVEPRKTEALFAKLEAAESTLTQKALKYWSQNRHLRLSFDVRPAQAEDGPGMTSGMNIWGRVRDTKHMVSTPLGTRSRGFVWFFSFLAWYSRLRAQATNLVLLLDEPGLSLHAKAQGDLLDYFEKELKPYHQLVYTTHSPFMIDPSRFDRVRIVQDLSIESDFQDLPDDRQGTKVFTDVLDATSDSLFPLQGALGYEIHQTLFVGPNCLVVEGVSDLLYIQALSALLQERGKCGLSKDWTITPVGGADKVPTFVALIGARTNLNVAVLIDFQKKDRQSVENLYKRKLLVKHKVRTYAKYVGDGDGEADVEDMFRPEFYMKLVNGAFGSSIGLNELPDAYPRILRRLTAYLEHRPLPGNANFNHYRPARYLTDNMEALAAELTDPELDRFERIFRTFNELL